jgi:hypothetical protein
MSDAIRIEQRLHELEQRLHDLVAGWGSRQGHRSKPGGEGSPREMEQQVMERLFADRRRSRAPGFPHDVRSARKMERDAVERLYGERSTVVVQTAAGSGDEDA